MDSGQIRERLAAFAHEQWSGWMDYLFSKCVITSGGGALIPSDLVGRWTRQSRTPYAELPEDEKGSDRIEADKMMDVAKVDQLREFAAFARSAILSGERWTDEAQAMFDAALAAGEETTP